MRLALATLILAPLLAGCTHAVSDLRLIGASRVAADAFPDEGQRRAPGWKVSLRGSANWATLIRGQEMSGYPVVVRCDDRDKTLFAAGPYVGTVRVAHGAPGFADWKPSDGPQRYDIYFDERGRYRSAADFNAPMSDYDLNRERIELCIRLGGGSMTGATARSNEVRITLGGSQ